jgi:hypothetical protein
MANDTGENTGGAKCIRVSGRNVHDYAKLPRGNWLNRAKLAIVGALTAFAAVAKVVIQHREELHRLYEMAKGPYSDHAGFHFDLDQLAPTEYGPGWSKSTFTTPSWYSAEYRSNLILTGIQPPANIFKGSGWSRSNLILTNLIRIQSIKVNFDQLPRTEYPHRLVKVKIEPSMV